MAPNDNAADGAQNASNEGASQGPPAELPDPVPDFVSEIHAAINDFLGGGVESLGEALQGVASSGMGSEAASAAADIAMMLPI
jgi:hypothetical protein